ncbi:MAG: hypothetical protein LBJ08_04500 [Bifidobacteriaceae bacterium]|jgi:hypothetical protein|nr:hypothetical protein [Bifidobacteriaceae bacterium]
MTGTFSVAWRFIRADAAGRRLGIVIAGGVASFLIATLVGMPGALSPGAGELDPTTRVVMAVVLAFVAIPVFMLLASAGRLGAGTRDRRLAALRMLGLSPARTVAVAVVENGVLALAGGLAGVGAFAVLAPPASAAVRAGPRWFVGSLTVAPAWLAVTAVGVAGFSAVLAAAPARRLRTQPKALRDGGPGRAPGLWRLGVFLLGAAALAWEGTEPRFGFAYRNAVILAAVVTVIVGLALSVPLLSNRAGRWLARSRRTVPMLAGRGILAEPSSGTRLVLGLGAVVFLTVAGAQQLWTLENDAAILQGQRVLGEGPQLLAVYAKGASLGINPQGLAGTVSVPEPAPQPGYTHLTVTDAQRRAVEGLTGVQAVVGYWSLTSDAQIEWDGDCDPGAEFCDGWVFTGTCAALAAFAPAATGCEGTGVQWMAAEIDPAGRNSSIPRPAVDSVTLHAVDPATDQLIGVDAALPLIARDLEFPRRPHRNLGMWWRQTGDGGLFIPEDRALAAFGPPPALWVLADGGLATAERLAAAIEPSGLVSQPESLEFYRQSMVLLTGFWALFALAISVAVINLAITAMDRARERRAILARQVSLGVPAQVLRRAQALQVAVPLLGAVILGAIGGAGAMVCYGLPDWRAGYAQAPWPQLGAALGAIALGIAAVLALTIPLTRVTLTAQLLRRE